MPPQRETTRRAMPMEKRLTAAQAAALVKDGCTLVTTGFNGFGCPEDLMMALAEHYDKTGHPRDLTLVKCTSQGDGKGRGISRLAEKPGMFRELILSHMGYDPGLRKLVQEEQAACYMLPLGNLMKLFQAIAGGLPGAIATTGLGTFADPRNGGGKVNQRAKDTGREVVSLIELGGRECLFYPAFPLDVCLLRATYGDEAGNLSIHNEAMNVEQFEVAAAVHNAGGIVIAQVDQIVKRGTIPAKEVLIHGFMVDYLVEGRPEYSHQSFANDRFRPEIAGLAQIPTEEVPPLAMGPRKICCRRAVMELRPDSLINLGIGMPGGIGSVAAEEGLSDLFTVSVECGPIGGIPLGGMEFGASVNPEAMYRMSDTLQLYDGGALDMAVHVHRGQAGRGPAGQWPGDPHPGSPEEVFGGGGVHHLLRPGSGAEGAGSPLYHRAGGVPPGERGHHPGGNRPRGGPSAGHPGPDGVPTGDS